MNINCAVCGRFVQNSTIPEGYPDKYKLCCVCNKTYKYYMSVSYVYGRVKLENWRVNKIKELFTIQRGGAK